MVSPFLISTYPPQLHVNQEHPDTPLLDHAKELIAKLESLGIQPSPDDAEDEDDGEGWEDVDSDNDGADMDMS